MNGKEIMLFLYDNLPTLIPPVQFFAGAVISAIFLRKKSSIETSTQEFEKIKAGHMKEAADALLESGKLTYTEYYKMNNFLEIAKKADKEFSKTYNIAPIPQQDFDWFIRFYESCGNVSDEDLQALWAKILAGEIREPGSYSYRTMEHLRNLSKDEAVLFKKICDSSLRSENYAYLPKYKPYLTKKSISYDDILKLEDCGLMKSDASISLGFEVDEQNYAMIAYSDKWVFCVKKKEGTINRNNKISIPEFIFTRSGSELFSVVRDYSNEDFSELVDVFNEWLSKYEFKRGRIIDRDDNHINYSVIDVAIEGSVKVTDSKT